MSKNLVTLTLKRNHQIITNYFGRSAEKEPWFSKFSKMVNVMVMMLSFQHRQGTTVYKYVQSGSKQLQKEYFEILFLCTEPTEQRCDY